MMKTCGVMLAAALAAGAAWAEPVKVSERFGFDPVDATKYIQAALDSGLPEIVVDRQAGPWITTPLFVRSNQKIVLEKGVVLLAKRGAYVGRNDRMLNFDRSEHVRLSGYGATLRMWRADYATGKDAAGRDYRRGEWRHAISIRGAIDVTVEGLLIEETGGDALSVGREPKPGVKGRRRDSQDIVLRDLVCDRNHRQGLSVGGVRNLLVENCIFRNTRGTWPMDGVDIEPDSWEDNVTGCVFRNCLSENNFGNGFEVALAAQNARSTPVSIRFENCRSVGCRTSAMVRGTRKPDAGYVTGRVAFDGCTFEDCLFSPVPVRDVPTNSLQISFHDCKVAGCAKGIPSLPLVLLEMRDPDGAACAMPDLSGLSCADLGTRARVLHSTRNFATLGERNIPCQSPEIREPRVIDRAPEAFASCPENRFSGKVRLVTYANRARTLRLRARRDVNLSKRPKLPSGKIVVTGLGNGKRATLPLPDYETRELAFAAPEAGFYAWEVDNKSSVFIVEATDAPLAVDCTRRGMWKLPIKMAVSEGALYVPVPAGREAAFVVGGDMPGDLVGMQVYDPSGALAFEDKAVLRWTRFVTPKAAADGLWRLAFRKPVEGSMWGYFAEVAGLPPYLFLTESKYWYSK